VIRLVLTLLLATAALPTRDDGRFENSPLKPWFDSLKSDFGPCCGVADGIADPDWESKDGHYRVRIDGKWIDVPDRAVIREPNEFQRSMVWPIRGSGHIFIRCFLPGTLI
jgi:hypothetical protein